MLADGDHMTWLRAQIDEDERVTLAAIGGYLYPDGHDAAIDAFLDRFDYGRILAEITAKRQRIDWLINREHDMGGEDFPTYDSCRILIKPGELGDVEVGYCSCGLDAWRNQLFRFEALPYAGRPGFPED